jgi:hypothetical protein
VTDDWVAELRQGQPERAWDLFVTRYRRLIFAAIRHYAQGYDDVMDVFARVCEALREDDLKRLRAWVEAPTHRARFSTWLVTVVRNLTIDWFRERDGRRRLPAVAESLPALQRRIFEHVFLDRRSHVETYELIRGDQQPALSFREFLVELRATYGAVTKGRRGSAPAESRRCISMSAHDSLVWSGPDPSAAAATLRCGTRRLTSCWGPVTRAA